MWLAVVEKVNWCTVVTAVRPDATSVMFCGINTQSEFHTVSICR